MPVHPANRDFQRLDCGSVAVTRQTPRLTKAWENGSGQAGHHFLVRRKAAGGLFGKGSPAIDGYLENPATALAQHNLRGRLGLQDQVPRRDRTRLVASHAAVFDFYPHLLNALCRLTALLAWQRCG
jgi:hypothetical protein